MHNMEQSEVNGKEPFKLTIAVNDHTYSIRGGGPLTSKNRLNGYVDAIVQMILGNSENASWIAGQVVSKLVLNLQKGKKNGV